MSAEEIAKIADDRISSALNANSSERLNLLAKSSYDLLYPSDVDFSHSISDAETFQRRLQKQRICDVGLNLALQETPPNAMFIGFLTDKATSIAHTDGTAEAIKFLSAALTRVKADLTPRQRLLILSTYPRLFIQRQKKYKIGSTDIVTESGPLSTLDRKFQDALSLEPLLVNDDERSRYLDMFYSFIEVYTDNGRFASADKALKAAQSFGVRIGKPDAAQFRLAMQQLKSSKEAAANTDKQLRNRVSSIQREKDRTKRESLLDDAWADVLLKDNDFDIAQYETSLARLWIAPQLADLKSSASALTFSPFVQLNWRLRLADRAVFQFLKGVVGTKPKSQDEQQQLIDEAIQALQFRANSRADYALLRAALRSLLTSPLKEASMMHTFCGAARMMNWCPRSLMAISWSMMEP